MEKAVLHRLVLKLVLLMCIAILTEIFVFNIRAFTTAAYNEQVIDDSYIVQLSGGALGEDGVILMDSDADYVCIDILGFGYPLRNIKLDVECVATDQTSDFDTSVCNVDVVPFDDAMFEEIDERGNSSLIYGAATCVETKISHDIDESQYIYLKNYGNTHSVEITLYPSFKGANQFIIHSLSFNVSRPMKVMPVRVLVLFTGLVIVYFSLFNKVLWEEDCVAFKGWKVVIVTTLFSVFSVATVYLILSNKNIMTDTYSPYAKLACALCDGKMYIGEASAVASDAEGSPVFWRADSDNVMLDYALFEGRYYVCFGLLPCIIFYIPYHIITGGNLPNAIPYIILRVMVTALVGLLLWMIIKKYYRKTPFALFLLMWWAVIGGMYLPVMLTTEVRCYDIPIYFGVVLILLGMIFALGIVGEDKCFKFWNVLFGSVCFSAVLICRPIMLLYGFVVTGCIIKKYFKQIKDMKRKVLFKAVLALAIPYIVFSLICMFYNLARFGSPFDFGVAYTTATYPVKDSSLFFPYVVYSTVYEYLLRPPVIDFGYPSAHFSVWTYIKEAGCIMSGGVFDGGLFMINPFVWSLFFQGHYYEKLNRRGLKLVIPVMLLTALGIMVMGSMFTCSIYTRYTLEFSPAILFSACLMIMEIQEDVFDLDNDQIKILSRKCITFLLLVSIFWGFMQLFCYSEGDMTVISGNSELWYKVINMFRGTK